MVKAGRPRKDSLPWRTFLKNQAKAIWTCDFCVQQTVRFTALYIFVVMELGQPVTREVNGKSVSCRSAFDAWLAETRGLRGIPTPYGAPNAQAHIERFIGTLRRELLDPTPPHVPSRP